MLNIIQIQDRLKGMPKEAIIQYVQNPTGDVPTYLALGELQRRKTMESKYNAMKPEAPSVAEQIVQENMPMGLASMPTQDVMPPQSGVGAPQPQPRPTPDMMASSGIGALPAGNIGQNYAGGGIVAFEEGGEVEDDYGLKEFGEDVAVEAALLKLLGPAGMFLSPGEAKASTLYSDEEFAKKLGYANGGVVNYIGGGIVDRAILAGGKGAYKYGKKGLGAAYDFIKGNISVPVIGGGAVAYDLFDDSDKEEERNTRKAAENKLMRDNFEEFKRLQDARLAKEKTEPVAKEKTMADYGKEFKDMMGTDEYRAKMNERMAKMDEKVAEREGKAPYFAIMEAGLAMAAESSPFALQNIAAGATRGISSYQESQEALQAMEEKRLALLDDMAKADRAEKVAAIEYGMNSQQFEDTQALKAAIANQEKMLKLAEINVRLTGTDPERGKIATDIIGSGEMQVWTEKFLKDKGSNYEDSPGYYDAYQAELGRRVNQRLRAGTERALYNTTNFNVIGM
jgi:hypothetical protein